MIKSKLPTVTLSPGTTNGKTVRLRLVEQRPESTSTDQRVPEEASGTARLSASAAAETALAVRSVTAALGSIDPATGRHTRPVAGLAPQLRLASEPGQRRHHAGAQGAQGTQGTQNIQGTQGTPVFVDGTGRRSRRVRLVVGLVCVLCVAYLVVLIASVFASSVNLSTALTGAKSATTTAASTTATASSTT